MNAHTFADAHREHQSLRYRVAEAIAERSFEASPSLDRLYDLAPKGNEYPGVRPTAMAGLLADAAIEAMGGTR